ncbi:MAG: zinc ribbon domain-containing protein [Clostridia bacterium]|nr:zinc ribbon domain-containing protein [Clostridia bacterium]
MNLIEKRKSQLKNLGIILLVISALALVGGILMLALAKGSAGLIIGGIVLLVAAVAGVVVGVIFTWTSSAVQATQGSIAEGNLGKGTVNMHKCSNCGVEIPEERTICEKCEENLKP